MSIVTYLVRPEHRPVLLRVELPGGGEGPGHVPLPDSPGGGDTDAAHLTPGAVSQTVTAVTACMTAY